MRRRARPGRQVTATRTQQAARDELIVRFGQTTGPVLAKGVEDTAFYRWSRLAALNEVGGNPDIFGVEPGGIPRRGQPPGRPGGQPP